MPDPEKKRSYERFTIPELIEAEARARSFFQDQAAKIAGTMRARVTVLERLIEISAQPGIEFEERLNTYAHIAEAAETLATDARMFFDLATAPMVVRTIRSVPPIKPTQPPKKDA